MDANGTVLTDPKETREKARIKTWMSALFVGLIGASGALALGRGYTTTLDWSVGPTKNFGGVLDHPPAGPFVFIVARIGQAFNDSTPGWLWLALAGTVAGVGWWFIYKNMLQAASGCIAYTYGLWWLSRTESGQAGMIIGAGVLVWLWYTLQKEKPAWWVIGLTWAACCYSSLHYLWLGGLVLVCWAGARKDIRKTVLKAAALGVGCVLPLVAVYANRLVEESLGSTLTFESTGWGIIPRWLAGFFGGGFFYQNGHLPDQPSSGQLMIYVSLAVVGVAGVFMSRKPTKTAALGLWAVGAVLSGTVAGQWLQHIPGGGLMREPGKFGVLVGLAMAVGAAETAKKILEVTDKTAKTMLIGGLLILLGSGMYAGFVELQDVHMTKTFGPTWVDGRRLLESVACDDIAWRNDERWVWDAELGRVVDNPANAQLTSCTSSSLGKSAKALYIVDVDGSLTGELEGYQLVLHGDGLRIWKRQT